VLWDIAPEMWSHQFAAISVTRSRGGRARRARSPSLARSTWVEAEGRCDAQLRVGAERAVVAEVDAMEVGAERARRGAVAGDDAEVIVVAELRAGARLVVLVSDRDARRVTGATSLRSRKRRMCTAPTFIDG
jgi:hypothetical protein